MEQEKPKTLKHLARESLPELLLEANERGITKEDIVSMPVKGNVFYLIYVD